MPRQRQCDRGDAMSSLPRVDQGQNLFEDEWSTVPSRGVKLSGTFCFQERKWLLSVKHCVAQFPSAWRKHASEGVSKSG